MLIQTLDPIPPKDNPFCHDSYHMGTCIGTNVLVMMPNFDNQPCPYMIVVNITTGQRVRIDFLKE